MKEIKKPTTVTEQVDRLIARGLIIKDREFAESFFKCVSYYNFSGYLFEFKNNDDSFNNIRFDDAFLSVNPIIIIFYDPQFGKS